MEIDQDDCTEFPAHPRRAEMLQEVAAYEALLPLLVEQYLGKYVAIYQGNVVDVDEDLEEIICRVREVYLDQIILIRKVEASLPPEIRIRSPRLIRENES